MLGKDFLQPYRDRRDPFKTLLARSTYLGKYCRDGETWTDTITRVVLGNIALDENVTEDEAEFLFDTFWNGYALPPGRGLWTGGVPNIPVDARYNCWYSTLRHFNDWCFVANMLACGGGVGVGLHAIDELPTVSNSPAALFVLCSKSHPNVNEVMPSDIILRGAKTILVDDSRTGWVSALRAVFAAAFTGNSLVVNVSPVRPRGTPIKTFGGTACGPGPLTTMLRQVWGIIRGARGRKLTSVECLDVTNHIGVCIKSGNVRRSALIVLGRADDQPFRDAKKDFETVMAHRHSSNNSIVFTTEDQIDSFDWNSLVEDNVLMGEPGILNLWKIRQTDPAADGVNPCGEIPLEDREACCLSEIYPALMPAGIDTRRVLEAVTRYTLRQRLQPMSDRRADRVRRMNMRIGVGLGGVCDFDWTPQGLANGRAVVVSTARKYADELDVVQPIAVTTVKPSGTISLLNGSSPGIHAPFANLYVRRTRIGKHEPMAGALIDAGVPHEPCVYDSTGQTLVFSFPMRSKARKTVQNQTVRDQIERQVTVQHFWADNSVSSTISFNQEEKGELAALLKKHAKDLKSISCLPRQHGYAQPPYEVIDEARFLELDLAIDHEHPLTTGGDLDTNECEGGVCPVR